MSRERVTAEIDPEHPLFTGGPLFVSEDPIEEDIDDVLYGEEASG